MRVLEGFQNINPPKSNHFFSALLQKQRMTNSGEEIPKSKTLQIIGKRNGNKPSKRRLEKLNETDENEFGLVHQKWTQLRRQVLCCYNMKTLKWINIGIVSHRLYFSAIV